MKKTPKTPNDLLTGYYGILQSLHLLVLIRAGLILVLENRSPFPLLPPPGGWQGQVLPFLLGLGVTDTVGILLGMHFAYQSLVKGRFIRRMGVISLTIFITGAVVFAAGTVASGAWAASPLAYGVMAVLFIPAPILYIILLTTRPNSTGMA